MLRIEPLLQRAPKCHLWLMRRIGAGGASVIMARPPTRR
jgi:hypothetical protein